ncbi:MAG: TetM/TetW/TetO/TetS family tetracycline resistance ribosomal protection protein [Solobacterium sp.]|nr:TetM/TetW/TetO/TetS family tetracycline resistance ribosomal protection protein [Solobacterium sp.]
MRTGRKNVIGILAHVDAGKTTCIENMLYLSGRIRRMGRVDHRDTVLDYDAQERERGITIYAKEAFFTWKNTEIYVIDTPGHADFSSEMERALSVLDTAVILINGQDGVQSHTETIWKCLEHYRIPAIIFVNKMDISHFSEQELLEDLQKKCSESCLRPDDEGFAEKLAMCDEDLLDTFIESGAIPEEDIRQAFLERKYFPVLFGSALKSQGIEALMDLIADMTEEKEYPDEFGAKVYKISQDDQGTRLTHMRITGGTLYARQKINDTDKADQIRIYSGRNYEAVQSADAGMICTVKGLTLPEAGSGLGFEDNGETPLLSAFMEYTLIVPEGADRMALADTCRKLGEEDPQLDINIDPDNGKITVRIMGAIQMEVLQRKIEERCGIHVSFGAGEILYKETIAEPVKGAGHFEPLRHYAEVHVALTPLPPGSGIEVNSTCPTDQLNSAWQKAILSALRTRHHRGVLTGSPLTDVRITLTAGKGSLRHTEGGDFRQAASRAVRQALMKADNVLLEPYYSFTYRVPKESLSRALYDLEQKNCDIRIEDADETVTIYGKGPAAALTNYQQEVIAYTHGKGRFTVSADAYLPCRSSEEIIQRKGYDPESDLRNPAGSVFCSHGAGYYVPWDEADELMHIQEKQETYSSAYRSAHYHVSEEDLKHLTEGESGRNRNEKKHMKPKEKPDDKPKKVIASKNLPECLIVDGYNMIYDWDELKTQARTDLSSAREHLIDILANYQAYTKIKMIIVFDGYHVQGNTGTKTERRNVIVVYTRADQTADSYIEKITSDLKGQYRFIAATSDGLIQNSVMAHGGLRMSARELKTRIEMVNREIAGLLDTGR